MLYHNQHFQRAMYGRLYKAELPELDPAYQIKRPLLAGNILHGLMLFFYRLYSDDESARPPC